MILPLKIALGVIASLLLALGGTAWYSSKVATERDRAVERAGQLETTLALVQEQAGERAATNKRLLAVLQARSAREDQMLAESRKIQEKINALSGTCVYSNDASRLLWEIYEGAGGVPRADSRTDPPVAAD